MRDFEGSQGNKGDSKGFSGIILNFKGFKENLGGLRDLEGFKKFLEI